MYESARSKVRRARDHLGLLVDTLDTYYATEPFGLDIQRSVFGSTARVAIKSAPPPELALLIGDFVHTLRTALDHVIYEAVAGPAEQHCAFPIAKSKPISPAKWQQRVAGDIPAQTTGAAQKLQAMVVAMEPWPGGADEDLWTVHRLDILDKHRQLVPVCAAIEGVTSYLQGHMIGGEAMGFTGASLELTWRPQIAFPLTNGQLLQHWGPGELGDADTITCELVVALAEPASIAGEDLRKVLAHLANRVEVLIDRADRRCSTA